MKKTKKLLLMALGLLTISVGVLGFSACLGSTPGPQGEKGEQGVQGERGEQGLPGQNGFDGVSIVGASVNTEGKLILTLSCGKEIDCGVVKGADGVDGEDGKDGQDGAPGQDGEDGKDGTNGSDGKDGQDGKDGVGVESVSINEKGELIIKLTDGTENNLGKVVGENGKDGVDGSDGEDGKDGQDGTNGVDGVNGQDGKDGVGIETIVINDKGEMVVTLSNETTLNLGKVVGDDGKDGANGSNGQDGVNGADGKDGTDGKDGVSVIDAEINADNELIFTLSNGETINAGKLTGSDCNCDLSATGAGVKKIWFDPNNELHFTLTDGTDLNVGKIPTCKHIYGTWVTVTEANCTSMGVKTQTCALCEKINYQFVSAIGHTYNDAVVKATCTEQGYTEHTCMECGYNYRDTYTAKTAHTYGDWSVMLSTCTTKISSRSCTVCGISELKSENYDGHVYTETMVEPNCTEQGYTLHTCTNCGKNYKDSYVAATGEHAWEDVYVVVSTCEERKVLKSCTVCGKTQMIEEEPTAEHDYTETVIEATCGEQGYTMYECIVCGDSYEDNYLEATGKHNYVDNVCTVCGDKLPVWDGTIATEFAGGSGTEADPYLISTGAQLAYLANCINNYVNGLYNKHYKLTNDINLNNLEWEPIGFSNYNQSSYYYRSFQGVFNGNGHKVLNLKITYYKPSFQSYGLFGDIEGGTVKTLGVENIIIDISSTAHINVGGLVGYNYEGIILDCYSSVNIKTSSSSSSAGTSVVAGGLMGYNNRGTGLNCYTTGKINAETSILDPAPSSSYGQASVGGLIGANTGTVSNCCATVDVIATTISTSSSSYCNAYTNAGGLIGVNYETVLNCRATGNISASSSVSSSNWGSSYAGGLVGDNNTGTISNCHATGNASATTNSDFPAAYSGGLVGYNSKGTITSCYSTGNINASGTSSQSSGNSSTISGGGLIGYCRGGNISNCYSTGNITVDASHKGNAYAGGLIGALNADAAILNCYATGNVQVSSTHVAGAGGLVGCNNYSGSVSNCFALGNVTALSTGSFARAGGIVGEYAVDILNCYRYETQTLEALKYTDLIGDINADGSVCTPSQLNNTSFYTSNLGWDSTIWDFSNLDFENGKMPTLK